MLKRNNTYSSFFDFTKGKSSSFFFICDHASNFIPKNFNCLGLSFNDIFKHIAWDIGAKSLTLEISKKLDSYCYLSNFSRLLIDPNRAKNQKDLIIKNSDGINIPGNKNLHKSAIQRRFVFYDSYHSNLTKILKCKLENNINLKLISIHSFNKFINGRNRPNEIGLLWNKNLKLLKPLLNFFQKRNINVGNNFPYSGFHFNHTLDKHSFSNNLDNISIEIRNDLIDNKKGVDKWSEIFKIAFHSLDKAVK